MAPPGGTDRADVTTSMSQHARGKPNDFHVTIADEAVAHAVPSPALPRGAAHPVTAAGSVPRARLRALRAAPCPASREAEHPRYQGLCTPCPGGCVRCFTPCHAGAVPAHGQAAPLMCSCGAVGPRSGTGMLSPPAFQALSP